MIKLRDYQHEAIDAVQGASERGVRRPLVALPTGTGKTVVFSELIRRRGGSALILAHRDELIQQARDKLISVAPELAMSVGIVKARDNSVRSPVVIASVQTLARRRRLEQLPDNFHTAVCDEAHHAAADSYLRIFQHLEPSPLLLGVTATPERSDSRKLREVWEELVYARSIEEMIAAGYLCDLCGIKVKLGIDLRKVRTTGGDFQQGDLGRALEEANAPTEVAAAFVEHAAERKALVFTPTVNLAHQTAYELRRAGVLAESLDKDTPIDERRAMLRRLDSGEAKVICNVGVLTEGFDCPSVDCIVVACPTKSRVKYVQMIGRGTRIFPEKANCLIMDMVGVSERLTVQSLPELFGLDEDEIEDEETVTQAKRRKQEREREPAEGGSATREAGQGFSPFSRESIHWAHLDGPNGKRWITEGGQRELLVLDNVPGEVGWTVYLLAENRARRVARHLDLGYAQGVAEEVIRTRGAVALADTRRAWRDQKSTPGQRGYLQKLGIPAAGLTRGEAADHITLAVAKRRLDRMDDALAERALAAASRGDSDSLVGADRGPR